jgi:membrane protein CcdC involved in cytochrome C biogenesis
LLFVVTILITMVALAQPEPIVWVSYVPLIPLFLLLATGIYMFVLPYVQRWRARG